MPTLEQRKEWHPPAETADVAVDRMKTLMNRLRYRGDEYNADIAEMEIMPFLKSQLSAGAVQAPQTEGSAAAETGNPRSIS